MGKHYNQGNVWGIVTKAEEGKTKEKHTPYLDIETDCSSEECGRIRAYGRLWGKEKIEAFKTAHTENEKAVFRLKGFYGQFTDEHGVTYSSYTFYDFQRLDGPPKGGQRAAFILVGELTGKELIDGEGEFTIELERSGRETTTEQKLTLRLLDLDGYYEVELFDLVELRGLIRKREGEDIFGGSTDDPIRPYVMQVKKRKRD